MSAPAFIPPSSTSSESPEPAQDDPHAPRLSPPLTAMVASIEAARAGMNAQFDALLAQVNSLAYTGAAINNARRARNAAEPSSAMPAVFGASPSAPATQRSVGELTDAIDT